MIGRFAPTPSGDFHLGNLRTAFLSWHLANNFTAAKANGSFWLRFEDLDQDRVRRHYYESQLKDLEYLGITWDHEPMRQSERLDRYADILAKLKEAGLTYPCYCSRKDIQAAVNAPHALPGLYPGTCRELSRRQQEEKASALEGRNPALRLNITKAISFLATFTGQKEILADLATQVTEKPPAILPSLTARWQGGFCDMIAGEHQSSLDDLVLQRSDGVYAYNLVSVYDDLSCGIDQVCRGSDLLSSTPTQLLLALIILELEPNLKTNYPGNTSLRQKQAILAAKNDSFSQRKARTGKLPGAEISFHYGRITSKEKLKASSPFHHFHVPLLRNQDNKRLAKRDGAVTIARLKAAGWQRRDILNLLAFTLDMPIYRRGNSGEREYQIEDITDFSQILSKRPRIIFANPADFRLDVTGLDSGPKAYFRSISWLK